MYIIYEICRSSLSPPIRGWFATTFAYLWPESIDGCRGNSQQHRRLERAKCISILKMIMCKHLALANMRIWGDACGHRIVGVCLVVCPRRGHLTLIETKRNNGLTMCVCAQNDVTLSSIKKPFFPNSLGSYLALYLLYGIALCNECTLCAWTGPQGSGESIYMLIDRFASPSDMYIYSCILPEVSIFNVKGAIIIFVV